MVVQRKDSGEVDTYANEQEVDVEEGGATLEDERDRRVGGVNVEEKDGGIEKANVEDMDVDDDDG